MSFHIWSTHIFVQYCHFQGIKECTLNSLWVSNVVVVQLFQTHCMCRWCDIWVPAKLAAHCAFCLARIDQTPDNVPSSRLWPSLICLIDGPGWSSPGNRWHHRGSVVCAVLQFICCFTAVWNNTRSYMMGGKTAGRDATKAEDGSC